MRLTIKCPAKINLFLSVGPRDARNYHPIRTVFQAIDLFDEMTIEIGSESHEVSFDDPSIPAENTVTRALRLLSEIVDLPPLAVTVNKRIPTESGLGGGSSNAAGIIRAAERIVRTSIPEGEKKGIAEAIGMDVPFFLVGGRAKGTRYGEQLTPVSDREVQFLVLARPRTGCNTAEAYRRLDAIEYDWRDFPDSDLLYNDFERVAPRESLDLMELLKARGARDAALSGSGSAVYGRFNTRQDAERCVESFGPNHETKSWVCRTLTRNESLRIEND